MILYTPRFKQQSWYIPKIWQNPGCLQNLKNFFTGLAQVFSGSIRISAAGEPWVSALGPMEAEDLRGSWAFSVRGRWMSATWMRKRWRYWRGDGRNGLLSWTGVGPWPWMNLLVKGSSLKASVSTLHGVVCWRRTRIPKMRIRSWCRRSWGSKNCEQWNRPWWSWRSSYPALACLLRICLRGLIVLISISVKSQLYCDRGKIVMTMPSWARMVLRGQDDGEFRRGVLRRRICPCATGRHRRALLYRSNRDYLKEKRKKNNYFTSSDPHRDIILKHIRHKFWHSFCPSVSRFHQNCPLLLVPSPGSGSSSDHCDLSSQTDSNWLSLCLIQNNFRRPGVSRRLGVWRRLGAWKLRFERYIKLRFDGGYVSLQAPRRLEFNRDRLIETFFVTFLRAYLLTSFSILFWHIFWHPFLTYLLPVRQSGSFL